MTGADSLQTPYRIRLWVLFASEARKAVVLRRGPKTHFQLIDWDLATDTFVPGQWMKGHVALCDLSPDGRKLLYWAHQYHGGARWRHGPSPEDSGYDPLAGRRRNRSLRKREARRKVPRYMRTGPGNRSGPAPRPVQGSWTAISTPPYFSALAIWPSIGHWTGGGVFCSNSSILLNEDNDGLVPKANAPVPRHFRIAPASLRTSMTVNAWHPGMCPQDIVDRVKTAVGLAGKQWFEWAAPRPNGDLLFACDGCIYRLQDWEKQEPADYFDAATKLSDFTGQTFTQVRPTAESMRW